VPSDDGPMAPLHAARACGATFLPAVPAFLRAMLELAPGALPESVRLVISAGAALAPEVAREFRARFGRKVHAFYGASEAGGIAYDRLGDAAERGTVGTPVDGVRIELSGEDGQVVVRSAALALGYVPDHDPALAGGRFVTSDCATLEHGELRLLGRKSECLNVDGRKVHPREIEAVLLRLPGVEDALVMKTDSPARAGELCWALVACADGALDRARVLEWCRAHLPPYKVPRRVTLVPRIPRNARGKIDEVALRAHVAGE
jgi:long-chain acyl-CoA synthetase